MKKRQAGIAGLLGLIAGQAITMYSNDKKLRKDMAGTSSLTGKGKLFWKKRVETNKKIVDEVATTDWKETANTIREDAKNDAESVKERIDEKKNMDWEAEGKHVVETLLEKTNVKETVQNAKDKATGRWKDVKESFTAKVDEIETKTDKMREELADKIDYAAESVQKKIQPKKDA